ncbi:amino acid ABC transporter substrate-binding protein [Acerihabitans arboris]|nr:amino acid ABC transporter substrate-binding protein [Acerihabitans arboris]
MAFNTRWAALALVMGVAATLAGCDNSGSAAQDKVIRLGATGQSFPSSYKENDKLVGYDVEVAETIAHDLGYKVVWTTADFSGLLGQLEAGKLDSIANNFVVTAKRQEKYNFSTSYLTYSSQIVTSAQNKDINSLDDLKGRTVAGVLGSNHITNLRAAFPDNSITIRTYETRDGAMSDTLNNRVQGYVNSKPVLLAEINKHQLPLKLVGPALTDEGVSFPFAKTPEGDRLLGLYNQELDKMREDGRLKALSEKYFGDDLSQVK